MIEGWGKFGLVFVSGLNWGYRKSCTAAVPTGPVKNILGFSHCLVFRQQQGKDATYSCSYPSPQRLSLALCSHIPVTGRCLSVSVLWCHFFGCCQACWKWPDQQGEQLAHSTGNAVPAQDPRCFPGKFTVRWHRQFPSKLHWDFTLEAACKLNKY